MVVAIDIGNSNTSFGIFTGGRMKKVSEPDFYGDI
jgi:pantothenate kinase type III